MVDTFESLIEKKEKIRETYKFLGSEERDLSAKLGLLVAKHIKDNDLLAKIEWSVSTMWKGRITIEADYYEGAGLELTNLLEKIDSSASGFYHFNFKLQDDEETYTTLNFNDGTLSIIFNDVKQAKEFMGEYKINADESNKLRLEISTKEQELDILKLVLKELGEN